MALRRIVRNRPSLSCSACRRRKIKCEKQRPSCANCVRSGDECIYDSDADHREKAAAKKRKVSLDHELYEFHDSHETALTRHDSRSPLHDNHSSHHDHDLQDAARRGSSCPVDPGPQPLDPVSSTSPGLDVLAQWGDPNLDFDFDFDLGLLTPSLSLHSFQLDGSCGFTNTEQQANASHCRNGTPTPTPPTSAATSPPFEGYVSTLDDGSKLYVERTFWALVSRDPDVYEQILRAANSVDQCKLSSLIAGDSPHMSLPPKHVCEALLQCFFLCVHPLLPIVHAPTLAARYGQLRAQLLGEHENIIPPTLSTSDAGFVALLWAVMYAGAVASANTPLAASTKTPDTAAFRQHLYTAFASAMKASCFPEAPTLDALVAALIVQSGLGREDVYQLRTAQIVGTLIRAARQLGLHREASRKGLGAVNSELGRRIWWTLVELDIQSAVVAGTELEAARVEGSSDTRMPAEFMDDQIVLAGENTSKSSAFLLFAVGRAEIARAMRHIVVRAYDRQRPNQRDLIELNDMVSALRSRIRAISARLPAKGVPEKGLVSSYHANVGPATHSTLYKDDAGSSTVFNFWARSVLHMLYLRTLILLQKRFVHEFTGDRQVSLWNALVRLCCQYIQSYLRLTRWSAASVYKWALQNRLQPLEETLILLTYLQTEPSPTEGDLVEHFVEEVLDMCYNSEHSQDMHAQRQNLWAILNQLKDQIPRRPHLDLPDFSLFYDDMHSSLLDESIVNSQWQQQQTNLVDLGEINRGLASFLQLEGFTDA